VEYSKRATGEFKLINYHHSASGDEVFHETESFEVRSYDYDPDPLERRAARLLLHGGLTGHQIVIDDIMVVLKTEQDHELNRVMQALAKQDQFAQNLVRSRRLAMDGPDLQQHVALDLTASIRGNRLHRVAAATQLVRKCLRNKATDLSRRSKSRPRTLQESESSLADIPMHVSRDAEKAREIIDVVRGRLSQRGRLALECALGETTLKDYRHETGCAKRTAQRYFVDGIAELRRKIEQVQAEDDLLVSCTTRAQTMR